MKFNEIIIESKQLIEDFRQKNPNGIVIIRGATATGKSRLSVELSNFFDVEIISSDSRQIFREMNIGTDKVSQEILKKIPHHQINIVNPDENYTAGQRQKDTKRIIKEIQNRGKLPMIVGGTGLYIDTIYKNFQMPEIGPDIEFREKMFELEEKNPGFLYNELQKIDPDEAKKLHPNSTRYITRALEIFHTSGRTKTESFLEKEVDQPILMMGIWREKDETIELINKRISEMIKSGLVDEVKGLLDKGYSPSLQSMQGIGYKEVIGYLQGNYDIKEMERQIQQDTQRLAKRQRTWFRRYIADEKENPKKNVNYKVWYLE